MTDMKYAISASIIGIAGMCFTIPVGAQEKLNLRDTSSGETESARLSPDKDTMIELILSKGVNALHQSNITGWRSATDTYIKAVLTHHYSVEIKSINDEYCATSLAGNALSKIEMHYRRKQDYGASQYVAQAKNDICRDSPVVYERVLAMLDDVNDALNGEALAKANREEEIHQEQEAIKRQHAVAAAQKEKERQSREIFEKAKDEYFSSIGRHTMEIYSGQISREAENRLPDELLEGISHVVDKMWEVNDECKAAATDALSGHIIPALWRAYGPSENRDGVGKILQDAYSSVDGSCNQYEAKVVEQLGASIERSIIDTVNRVSAYFERQKEAIAESDRRKRVKSGESPITSVGDAILFYDASQGGHYAAIPMVNPSSETIFLTVVIVAVESSSILKARVGKNPVIIRMSGQTKNAIEDTMRINHPATVVGTYSQNATGILGNTIPVIDALFIGP